MAQSKEETIAYHKGALSVLAKEQESLMQILSVVQQYLQMHVKALKELGVDIEAEAKKVQETMEKKKQEGIDSRLK